MLEIGNVFPGERADWLARTTLRTPLEPVRLQDWMRSVAVAGFIAKHVKHFQDDEGDCEKDAVLGLLLMRHNTGNE